MDIPGALNTLATGLANTFNKPAFNSIGTIGDALFTNTPPPSTTPDPQNIEAQRPAEGAAV
jgi:hypothetical protein